MKIRSGQRLLKRSSVLAGLVFLTLPFGIMAQQRSGDASAAQGRMESRMAEIQRLQSSMDRLATELQRNKAELESLVLRMRQGGTDRRGADGSLPGTGRNPAGLFAMADANGDQELAGDEFAEFFRRVFGRLDADNSGKLNRQEFMSFFGAASAGRDSSPTPRAPRPEVRSRQRRPGQQSGGRRPAAATDNANSTQMRQRISSMLERFDANKDGKLQRNEVPEGLAQNFERLDVNGDGALEPGEIAGRGNRGNVRPRRD